MKAISKSRVSTLTYIFLVLCSTAVLANNRLSEARMAAVEGDHARCAIIADEVRKSNQTSWYAQQVFASCQALDAQKKKNELGRDAYEIESMKAITAIEDIISKEKQLTSRQRIEFSYMAVEMRKLLKRDLREMTKN